MVRVFFSSFFNCDLTASGLMTIGSQKENFIDVEIVFKPKVVAVMVRLQLSRGAVFMMEIS